MWYIIDVITGKVADIAGDVNEALDRIAIHTPGSLQELREVIPGWMECNWGSTDSDVALRPYIIIKSELLGRAMRKLEQEMGL